MVPISIICSSKPRSLSKPVHRINSSAGLVSFLSVLANKEVPAEALRGIIESELFVQIVQSLEILRFELEVTLQVAFDAGGGFAFRQYGVPIVDAPC